MLEYLHNKMLTLKLTILIALTSSTTAHEICSLNTGFLVKHIVHYTFQFSKITIIAGYGSAETVFDKNICVCHHIEVYVERARAWRKNKEQRLVSFYKSYLLPPRRFFNGLLRFCHYLGLILLFLRFIQQHPSPLLKPRVQALLPRNFQKENIGQGNLPFENSIFVGLTANVNNFNNQLQNKSLNRSGWRYDFQPCTGMSKYPVLDQAQSAL